MKILQVVPVFSNPFGGPVTVVRSISKELAKRHEVVVYTTTALDHWHDFGPKVAKIDGYKVIYFKRACRQLTYTDMFGQLNLSYEMLQAVKRNLRDFDVVHVHSWQQFPDVLVHHFATKYNVPYVLQVHGSLHRVGSKQALKWFFDSFIGSKLLKDASKVIAISHLESEEYKAMGLPDKKIAVIPNGVDLSQYTELPSKGLFRKKYGIDENKKVVLYFGRIHRTKGIDFLIKGYKRLIQDFKLKDGFLVIAGPDDGYLSDAKLLVSDLGVSDRVLFTGSLTAYEKVSAFVDSSIVVSPERSNVFLLVPLEAAACGKAVIVSNTNYISHMINEGGFGFSVKYGDINDLAEIMSKMLNNFDLLRTMGQNGRKYIFENYNWADIVTKFEKVYQEVSSCS